MARQKKKREKLIDQGKNKEAAKIKTAPLAGFINNMLPERAKAIFGQYGVEMAATKSITEEGVAAEVEKIAVRPQDVILTEEALEQYNLPLLDGIEFTADQVDILQKTVSLIVGGKLPALDAAVSKNKSVSPLVAAIKKQLYVKNGPIHKILLDIIGKDSPSVEAFFKNTKVKRAMLDALTTTWLAKHLPMAVQKEVNGIGCTTDWKGRK